LHQIVFADGGAAGRHQNIGRKRARVADCRDGGFQRVVNDTEIFDVGAFCARQRGQRIAVGIDDLSRPRFAAGGHQLVAGREQRDFRAAIDRQQRMIHSGGKRQIARGQAMAFGEQDFAFAKV